MRQKRYAVKLNQDQKTTQRTLQAVCPKGNPFAHMLLRFDSHTFRILAKIEHKRTAADDDDDEAEKKPTAGAAFPRQFQERTEWRSRIS